MAPHSSTLAWKIPWTEKPGGLQSMGLLGVGHDWATSFSLFTFMHWRRKWQPTPVLLPGKSRGRRSLVGYSLWGHKESDTTQQLHFIAILFLTWGKAKLSFIMAASFYHQFPVSSHSPWHLFFPVCLNILNIPSSCKVVSHCGSDLHNPNN